MARETRGISLLKLVIARLLLAAGAALSRPGPAGENVRNFCKKGVVRILGAAYNLGCICGRSSVVERHVANVNVVSSNLIARFGAFLRTGRLTPFRNGEPK